MNDQPRRLEFEIEVDGTPEEVWEAIATGPGISSWYVPHDVEERKDGVAVARFGPGPETEVPGRVADWDPPKRVLFDGGEDVEGLAFEWLVEARDRGTCVVRMVNSGFRDGDEWDMQYDGMKQGWKLFLLNLQLHLRHFRGQKASAGLPTTVFPGSQAAAWHALTTALGVPSRPSVGQTIHARAHDDLALRGEVVKAEGWWIALILDEPEAGTAFVATEPMGDEVAVSVWFYLYGDSGSAAVERDEPRWQRWLSTLAENA